MLLDCRVDLLRYRCNFTGNWVTAQAGEEGDFGMARLSTGWLASVALAALAQPSQAQEPVQAQAADQGGFADIIVTAQRRAERLQDVPDQTRRVNSDRRDNFVAGEALLSILFVPILFVSGARHQTRCFSAEFGHPSLGAA